MENQQLITLTEVCQILLSASPNWIKHAVCKKLETRWLHVRSKYISETCRTDLFKDAANPFGNVRKRPALPYDYAVKYVQSWIPYAVNEIKKDVDDSIAFIGGLTPEAIAIGESAPEEY